MNGVVPVLESPGGASLENAVVTGAEGESAAAQGTAEALTLNQVGQAGEAAVRGAYDIGAKVIRSFNGKDIIPDGLSGNTVSEVKNVAYQALTAQLRGYIIYAEENGLTFDLYMRSSTIVSGPLQKLIDQGVVNRLVIPGW